MPAPAEARGGGVRIFGFPSENAAVQECCSRMSLRAESASIPPSREACQQPAHHCRPDQEGPRDDDGPVRNGRDERKSGEREVGQEYASDDGRNAEPPVTGALIEMAAVRL